MKPKVLLIIALVLVSALVCATPGACKVIYVNCARPDDTGDGLTWTTAKQKVQSGLNASSAGDDVWVAAGVYYERVTLKADVSLYGGFPAAGGDWTTRDFTANVTVIDANKIGSPVTSPSAAGTTARIDGFAVRNSATLSGSGSGTAGVVCTGSSPTICNCAIVGNAYGVYCTSSSPVLTGNLIADNSRTGLVCYASSPAAIRNNRILRNSGAGISCSNSSPLIACNIIANNSSGGIFCASSSPNIVNNTIVGNWANEGDGSPTAAGGIVASSSSAPTVSNNVVAFNSSGIREYDSLSAITLHSNCVWNPDGYNYKGVAAGDGDISADPCLVPAGVGRFHVQPGSPCVDAGSDASVQDDWLDIDGQPRKLDGDADGTVAVDIGADESDGTTWTFSPVVVRVAPGGNDGNSGADWQHPKATVQAAIETASEQTGQVWVAAGTYAERITFRDGVSIYGGFAGTEAEVGERDWNRNVSILDGSGGCAATISGAMMNPVELDGFTIRGGTSSTAAIQCTGGSPTISHNRISGGEGNGINVSTATPIISCNLIVANARRGISCSKSAALVLNNTLVGNADAAIYSEYASALICNNLVAFNAVGIAGKSTGTQAELHHNCVYNPGGIDYSNVAAGGTDISVDPELAVPDYGEVHLLSGSPCTDAGDDTVVQPGWVDWDGSPRIFGDHVDIGADEFDGTVWSYTPAIVRVSPSGDDSNNGSSWGLAKKTVQAAVDAAAVVGGEVWVAAGTYSERVAPRRFVHLYGGFAGTESLRSERDRRGNRTTIEGTSGWAVFTFTNLGFRTGTLDGFTLGNGNASAGVSCSYSSPVISNNTITRNAGAGVSCSYAHPLILGNIIARNTGGGGVYCSYSSAIIVNNFVIANTSTSTSACGIYCTNSAAAVISGNTIVGNVAKNGGMYTGGCLASNNIVAFNSAGAQPGQNSHHNCYYNPGVTPADSPGVTDICVDPQLVNWQYGEVHLLQDSPCIDAGNDEVRQGGVDIDGDARNIGDHIDIGADEFSGTPWSYTPTVIRVSPAGDDLNDGSGWSLAKKTIQAGIDLASDTGGEVWVAAGTYYERINLKLFAHVYGGFAGGETSRAERNWAANPTVLDGQTLGSVVTSRQGFRSSTISGFVIRNGLAMHVDYSENYGGGVCCYLGSPIIANNRITGNRATHGGGIACYDASPLIVGNVITGNAANSSHMVGGGISCEGFACPLIVNNTIVGNVASRGGGIYCSSATPVITNNIIAMNSSGVAGGSGTLRNNCSYNPDGDNYDPEPPSGQGNFVADPRLERPEYGKVHLLPGSPCIDAGADGAPISELDIDSLPRVVGNSIDIGADEYDGALWAYAPVAIRVSASGDDDNDGSTWALAKRTIQAGVDSASAVGGDVWVAAGTYQENVNVKPFASLLGGFVGNESSAGTRDWRGNATVIDGQKKTAGITIEHGSRCLLIDGLCICNGSSGIVCNLSSPIISHNIIRDNAGWGIRVGEAAAPAILNNVVVANADDGVSAGTSGAGMVVNNVIAGNAGVGVNAPVVVNNTICGNQDGGVFAAVAVNNIVAFNAWGIWLDDDNRDILHNCVYNPDGQDYKWNEPIPTPFLDPSNLSFDPMLVAPQYGRMHLSAGSRCIDAGDSSFARGLADIDGDARVIGARVDLGADEWNGVEWGGDPVVVRVSPSGNDVNDGSSWASAKRTLQSAVESVRVPGGEVWAAAGSYSGQVNLMPFVHLLGGFQGSEMANDQRRPSVDISTIVSTTAERGIYVDRGFLVHSIDGFTIAGGGYGVDCHCGSPVISHNRISNNATGIYCAASGARIESNTISGSTSWGIRTDGGSPTILCNEIIDNRGQDGTGICCTGYDHVLIARNIISRNRATLDTYSWTGGIQCSAPATICDNLIFGNSAYAAAAVSCSGFNAQYVVNNTIVDNTSSGGGGVISFSSPGEVSNNIISYNTGGITRLDTLPYTVVVRNNDVFNPGGPNYTRFDPGQGDISADPRFANRSGGDYHLAANSPCINTGWGGATGVPQWDFDGQLRIAGPAMDIGADEYWGAVRLDQAKRFDDHAPVRVTGPIITAAFPDFLYVESPNRVSGIRVDKQAHGLSVGAQADVSGTVQTNSDGERYIAATSIANIGNGSVGPLALTSSKLGGGAMGLQSGVPGTAGLNNIGLLIRTWGKFTKTGDTTFTIDDGSGRAIKCVVERDITLDPSWTFVAVMGISSCEKLAGELHPLVRVLEVAPM